MIPNQTLTPYPKFGDTSSKVKPDDPKYSAGFIPTDVLPAEWLNWFLNRASTGVTELGEGVASMEEEINNVLTAGGQTPDKDVTNQLITAINAIIDDVRKEEQQLPPIGVPTIWFGAKPDWALDFGNGAITQYLWANYPKLNNNKFKGILSTLSAAGWMTAYDASGFYVPDLRGVVPVGYGTNGVRTGETTAGGNLGEYLPSANKEHTHEPYSNTFAGQYAQAIAQKNDGTPWTNGGTTNTNPYGVAEMITTAASVNVYLQTASSAASRITRLGFGTTPQGTLSLTLQNQGTTAKPPTIGCMYIVRFE